MTKLTILTADDKLTEIRRLYFATTKQSIAADFARAVQLLKSMESEDERERATVYMEGIAQMQKDWARESGGGRPSRPRTGRPGGAKAGASTAGAPKAGASKAGPARGATSKGAASPKAAPPGARPKRKG